MITSKLLRLINPQLTEARAADIARGLSAAATGAGITTPARVAAFLAQLAHESCGFRYCEEIWGPTPAQRRYEGRTDLGNTVPGDGYRYRGRGWIQLTGRHNYRKFGKLLGLDLEGNPDLAARPEVAARLAAAYWTSRELNGLADAGNFREITRKINGGYNGLADRERYHRLITGHLAAQPGPTDLYGTVLLVPPGGGEPVPWNGRDIYHGQNLRELVPQLRQVYSTAGLAAPGSTARCCGSGCGAMGTWCWSASNGSKAKAVEALAAGCDSSSAGFPSNSPSTAKR